MRKYQKQITLFMAVLLSISIAVAQAPNKFSYQAVVRNASNAVVANTNVKMRISILQTSASGTAVYVETQTATTNINGLVGIIIGNGTVVSGNLSTINWSNGIYFIKTETDPTGGTNYTISGSTQLLSVPYALNAATATTALSAAPTGTANGDLNGTYPNPTVDGLQGRSVSNTAPTNGQVLAWSGTAWTPTAATTGGSPTGTANGDLNGTYPNPTVDGLQGRSVSNTAPTNGQVLAWNGTAWAPTTSSASGSPTGTANGDLNGTYPNPTVDGLQGRSVSNTAPTNGQVLAWNGTAWAPSTSSASGSPTGAAGGDLGGTYPNPSVAKLGGKAVTYPATAQDWQNASNKCLRYSQQNNTWELRNPVDPYESIIAADVSLTTYNGHLGKVTRSNDAGASLLPFCYGRTDITNGTFLSKTNNVVSISRLSQGVYVIEISPNSWNIGEIFEPTIIVTATDRVIAYASKAPNQNNNFAFYVQMADANGNVADSEFNFIVYNR